MISSSPTGPAYCPTPYEVWRSRVTDHVDPRHELVTSRRRGTESTAAVKCRRERIRPNYPPLQTCTLQRHCNGQVARRQSRHPPNLTTRALRVGVACCARHATHTQSRHPPNLTTRALRVGVFCCARPHTDSWLLSSAWFPTLCVYVCRGVLCRLGGPCRWGGRCRLAVPVRVILTRFEYHPCPGGYRALPPLRDIA